MWGGLNDSSGSMQGVCIVSPVVSASKRFPSSVTIRGCCCVSSEDGVRAWTHSNDDAPLPSPGSWCNQKLDISKVWTAVIRTAAVSRVNSAEQRKTEICRDQLMLHVSEMVISDKLCEYFSWIGFLPWNCTQITDFRYYIREEFLSI